jgi:hypothetical protein
MAMARLPFPRIGGRLAERVMTGVANGPVGRALAPVVTGFGFGDRRNSFIVNIGDDGATVVQLKGGLVVDAIFAEASAEDGWDALREMLQADRRASIVLVVDVLEQMFREDTVPKVGIFDRSKLIQRRLDLTFPNDLLKAALPSRRQRGAPQGVLFAALPMSAHLERWLEFLDEFPNPLRGFYMLPLEAAGFAGKLAPSVGGETRRVWRALISQEAASGFRQVFESNGKLIVTRLTQRAAQPLSPDAEAMLIERELRSSISYVKRLGFSDADRLDVVVLADPAVCRAVDQRDLPATTVTAYTPYQAAIVLGLGEIGRQDTPFADVLLGLWIAKKPRPTLTLPSPRIARQMKLTAAIRWSAATAAVLSIVAIYYTASLMTDFLASSDEIAFLEGQVQVSQSRLNNELARVKDYPIPLDELTQVAQTERLLDADEVNVGEVVRKIAGALGADGRVSSFSIILGRQEAVVDPTRRGRPAPAKTEASVTAKPAAYEIDIVVRLAPDTAAALDTQEALRRAQAILDRLSGAFPALKVEATKLPGGALVNQVLEGSAKSEAGGQVPTAEYVLRSNV